MTGSIGDPGGTLDPGPVLAALHRHAVRYVVIGGVAAQLHGSTEPTRGLDLTPERSPANLARLAAALADLRAREWVPGFGYPLQLPMDRRRLTGDRVLCLHTGHGRVDVVPAPHGLPRGYQELAPHADRKEAYGQPVLVARLDDLVRSHAAAARGKDAASLARLFTVRERVAERGPLPPFEVASPAAIEQGAGQATVHDALAAAQRLATVFDDIRPALAYVRRELYRAVDNAMYGDEAGIRDAVARAKHAGSTVQADIAGLRADLRGELVEPKVPDQGAQDGVPPFMGILAQQADEEVRTSLRLLRDIAAQPLLIDRDEVRDLLIEARLHTAAADNHANLLQIQLERVARTWEREPELHRDFGQGGDT